MVRRWKATAAWPISKAGTGLIHLLGNGEVDSSILSGSTIHSNKKAACSQYERGSCAGKRHSGFFLRLGANADCGACEDFTSLSFAPLSRRDAHVALEGALEGRFGLVPDHLRYAASGKG